MKQTVFETETARTSAEHFPIPATSDSELIAACIRNFKYDPERREAVLAKYENLLRDR